MADVATRTPESDPETTPESVRPRRFTREEYFRMAETGVLGPEDRTELIDGHLVEMTAQNAPHRAAVGKVDSQFQQILQGRNYWVQTQATLPLDCRNVPEPDIAILSGAPDDLLDGEPDEIPLIVEVSDTTLTYDRTEKLACYASNDIPGVLDREPPGSYAGVLSQPGGRRVPRAAHTKNWKLNHAAT
jgi:Uma2 family endonuclease